MSKMRSANQGTKAPEGSNMAAPQTNTKPTPIDSAKPKKASKPFDAEALADRMERFYMRVKRERKAVVKAGGSAARAAKLTEIATAINAVASALQNLPA